MKQSLLELITNSILLEYNLANLVAQRDPPSHYENKNSILLLQVP